MTTIYKIFFITSFFGMACVSGDDKKTGGDAQQHGHELHGQAKKEPEKKYTCPMHPEILSNEPGKCPKCGMNLVESTGNENKEIKDEISLLLKPANEYIRSEVKMIVPQQKEIQLELKGTGKITYDDREKFSVAARIDGWIEKSFVKYRHQPVSKGQKLVEIYSRELETEQENYIFLLKNDAENHSLIEATEKKLKLAGLSSEQIAEIRLSGKTLKTITVYSTASGILDDKTSSKTNAEEMKMQNSVNENLVLKQGDYVKKGETLFTIYNTRKVWAVIRFPGNQAAWIKTGQPAEVFTDTQNPLRIKGNVDFIEPVYENGEKYISVRIYLNNPNGNLKIGMFVNAIAGAGNHNGIFVPASSVVHLGNNKVVFKKDDGLFYAVKVVTGTTSGNSIEIISGISQNDSIAENGQMLTDSESFIKMNSNE